MNGIRKLSSVSSTPIATLFAFFSKVTPAFSSRVVSAVTSSVLVV